MNPYAIVGVVAGNTEAASLRARLMAWHDAMVNHQRAMKARRAACGDDCPHEQARILWAEALDVFGDDAGKLEFLRKHGDGPVPHVTGLSAAVCA